MRHHRVRVRDCQIEQRMRRVLQHNISVSVVSLSFLPPSLPPPSYILLRIEFAMQMKQGKRKERDKGVKKSSGGTHHAIPASTHNIRHPLFLGPRQRGRVRVLAQIIQISIVVRPTEDFGGRRSAPGVEKLRAARCRGQEGVLCRGEPGEAVERVVRVCTPVQRN